MAALATTAVSQYPANRSRDRYVDLSQRGLVWRQLKLTLTGQGGATNTIGATAIGFKRIHQCSSVWDAEHSKGYPAVVDPVNNIIILLDGSAAPAPVDVSSTAAYVSVLGTV